MHANVLAMQEKSKETGYRRTKKMKYKAYIIMEQVASNQEAAMTTAMRKGLQQVFPAQPVIITVKRPGRIERLIDALFNWRG